MSPPGYRRVPFRQHSFLSSLPFSSFLFLFALRSSTSYAAYTRVKGVSLFAPGKLVLVIRSNLRFFSPNPTLHGSLPSSFASFEGSEWTCNSLGKLLLAFYSPSSIG